MQSASKYHKAAKTSFYCILTRHHTVFQTLMAKPESSFEIIVIAQIIIFFLTIFSYNLALPYLLLFLFLLEKRARGNLER